MRHYQQALVIGVVIAAIFTGLSQESTPPATNDITARLNTMRLSPAAQGEAGVDLIMNHAEEGGYWPNALAHIYAVTRSPKAIRALQDIAMGKKWPRLAPLAVRELVSVLDEKSQALPLLTSKSSETQVAVLRELGLQIDDGKYNPNDAAVILVRRLCETPGFGNNVSNAAVAFLAKAQVRQAQVQPEKFGEAAVDILMNEPLKWGTAGSTIKALEKVGTPRARAALLQLAISDTKLTSVPGSAAHSYARLCTNKMEVRALFQSTKPEAVCVALRAHIGTPLDADLLRVVRRLLVSDNFVVRWNASSVLGRAPNEDFALEKATALVQALFSIEEMYQASRLTSVAFYPASMTEAEFLYAEFINALATAKGVTVAQLASLTPKKSVNPRDCVLLARYRRGDLGTADDVKRIARSSSSAHLRSVAVWALADRGTVQDIPFLEEITQNDPQWIKRSEAEGTMESRFVDEDFVDNKFYPVRWNARNAIKRIREQPQPQPAVPRKD